ncbi:hypothetical protein DS2_07768 [Catenovulum agarivorans DS-2]|uniref:Peptidoglycan peptidase n=1 Tax=Catenovulum agarivorans DS-2 TaxID=1328313 RepID=W7QCA0_9ALTE|nr:YiiX/YebB-like N1pC/P60 family cysteine hydrolase [Catenovulum agarivorans]EWH10514.1 hypothetical protein DS2_07768 [Catenovulum agarivorans DS-2]
MANQQININTKQLREGDIIFTSIPNYLYQKIQKGTKSKTSHVGILFKNNNQWWVAESKIPFAKYSTLNDFVARSKDHWFEIKRVKRHLTQAQVEQLKKSAEQRMGGCYDLSFNYHSNKLFCSKFVYDVFKEACNIKIGELESFNALIEKNPSSLTLFWRVWFCGFIPYNTITVTPQSQLMDRKLQGVCGCG